MTDAALREALSRTLAGTNFASLGKRYEGKVRDTYTRDGTRLLIATDRISAFDRVLGTIPWKGQVLTQLAAYWFRQTTEVAPNHMIDVPDPCVMRVKDCAPFHVEFVVRGYATGNTSTSLWTHYARGERNYAGYKLPEGLKKHQHLEAPLVTPATKAPKGEHDVTTCRDDLVARRAIGAEEYDAIASMALSLFERGQAIARSRGLLLVDTKYEFGRTSDGTIVVIDEIHTPDSSRYWIESSYESRLAQGQDPEGLDKDYVRNFYLSLGYKGDGPPPAMTDEVRVEAAGRYIQAYERITNEVFVPNEEEPISRLERTLGA